MTPLYKSMLDALASMSFMIQAQFPKGLRDQLVEHSKELDRLRAELNELRSKIEKE